eukprot:TRINITY_DN45439_c2_g1_i1.p4 TRINITY_DN45439_c2_g1~~TRINITY_DN45439_c2_g1_i1.p4  ORF type:complete len:103 (-),score=4.85 TRINITY_DN45439_c2_g1_i1:45-353(-)
MKFNLVVNMSLNRWSQNRTWTLHSNYVFRSLVYLPWPKYRFGDVQEGGGVFFQNYQIWSVEYNILLNFSPKSYLLQVLSFSCNQGFVVDVILVVVVYVFEVD